MGEDDPFPPDKLLRAEEMRITMRKIYECEVCGVVSKVSEDLCRPDSREDILDYCASTRGRAATCAGVKENLPIVCGACGRPAKQPDLVCKPLQIG